MATPHKWADVIIAIANGEPVQFIGDFGQWVDLKTCKSNPISHPQWDWRIKPRTITIGGTEIPAPITEPPADGTAIFISVPSAENMYVELTWTNVSLHGENVLRRGIAHLTASDAFEHSKALIAVSGGRVE